MSTARLGLRRMKPRDPFETFRAASPLELFFDLVFVVAVSMISAQLHHFYAENHVGEGIVAFLLVFFGIWWAWMNFTWFATSFDTDDWLYRILTIIQMAGALVLAGGVGAAMSEGDFTVATLGYLVMRVPLVCQWLRAAASSPELRVTALRYAGGVAVVQVLWLLRLLLPAEVGIWGFLVLVLAEVSVPVWAETARKTPWHPSHIAERYGCFTLIVLGESILASTGAIVDAAAAQEHLGALLPIAACGLVLAAGMWWIYFSREHHEHFGSLRNALTFGYGHYLVFAAAASFSAGIEVAIDFADGHAELGRVAAAATLTVPIALFVLTTWFITLRKSLPRPTSLLFLVLTVLLAACAFVPGENTLGSMAAAAVVMILLVVLLELPATLAASERIEELEEAEGAGA
ncbi:low temperature requirement protein A [Arthrobacter woluwensis]|nr:low temperature requirement protein A [Arthrobacter woluwensis]